jgi:hypothetical protein
MMRVSNELLKAEIVCTEGGVDCPEKCPFYRLDRCNDLPSKIDIAYDLLEAREHIKELLTFCRDISSNYDCDSDGHKYGTGCRSCEAQNLLDKFKEYICK